MTQKELLYIEDAYNHEKNIISIINETINLLEDNDLISFLEDEKEKHASTKEDLLNCLEEYCNE